MIHKVMMIATAAAAAVGLTVFEGPTPQAQGRAGADPVRAAAVPLVPGEVLPADLVDFIEQPGRYGLGTEPRGSRYAIVQGHLVRVDADTMELQSVLRKDSVAYDRPPARP